MVSAKKETRLFRFRLSKGWTQERLARTSGVSVHTIAKLEQGVLRIEHARLHTVLSLAYALGIPMWRLIDDYAESEKARRVGT